MYTVILEDGYTEDFKYLRSANKALKFVSMALILKDGEPYVWRYFYQNANISVKHHLSWMSRQSTLMLLTELEQCDTLFLDEHDFYAYCARANNANHREAIIRILKGRGL